jgi:hypothetical protein
MKEFFPYPLICDLRGWFIARTIGEKTRQINVRTVTNYKGRSEAFNKFDRFCASPLYVVPAAVPTGG